MKQFPIDTDTVEANSPHYALDIVAIEAKALRYD